MGETRGRQINRAQQSREAAAAFERKALLKSALALIKYNGCKREERGKKEANPCWIPGANLLSSASKMPFDLQGAERSVGAGKRHEEARISFSKLLASPLDLLYQGEFRFAQPETHTEDAAGFFCAEAKANANQPFSLKEY